MMSSLHRLAWLLVIALLPIAASAQDLGTACDTPVVGALPVTRVAAPDNVTPEQRERLARARALIELGNELDDSGRPMEALAAYREAIQLGLVAEAQLERAMTFLRLRQFASALSDINEAIARLPDSPVARAKRAYICFELGRFASVVRDMSDAIRLGSSNIYYPLLRHAARFHLGEDGRDELRAATTNVRRAIWPGPVLALLLGEADVAAVERAVSAGGQQEGCEAPFYLGIHHLMAGDRAAARAAFARGIADPGCIFVTEYCGARGELARLGSAD